MKTVVIAREKQRLDALFDRARDLQDDPELLAHWARYLCVLVSGFIENALKSSLASYAENHADRRIVNFVQSELRDLQNAKVGKILEWLGNFDPQWRDRLDSDLDESLKDAVNSVVTNRHLIAHGRTSGISFATMKDYWERVTAALEVIEEVISS